MEKLEIKNTAVSNPSLRIAKKTTKKTPHDESLIALKVLPSSSFLSPTCLDSQNITYHIKNAVRYKNVPSNRAAVESFPKESLAIRTRYPTIILATMAAKHPSKAETYD